MFEAASALFQLLDATDRNDVFYKKNKLNENGFPINATFIDNIQLKISSEESMYETAPEHQLL